MTGGSVRRSKGFTLIEVMLVAGVVVILAGLSISYYGNATRTVDRETSATLIGERLKEARTRALAHEDAKKWGVHFVNVSGASHYYEVFETPTIYSDGSTVVKETYVLPTGILFSDPATSTTKDILFSNTGTTTASSVRIVSQNVGITVNVNAQGLVYK